MGLSFTISIAGNLPSPPQLVGSLVTDGLSEEEGF
jgi:hypothetical protein